ncbi:peptide ABC transporter substrate-binding protein [Phytoactinopolyspora halotolerans]|uniref:ABC transporter substrate-binding protein n=1 Tax=Phytoactinopolyspora halotolerans TaxID=1981512 RepID=A0A6L9SF71_9ACTN|nr:ABC transporter substrate-binding protein [Phytoactinopolyspora halotolerans]NEE04045.1 ABC transporter substrate-binding protein [Phytoactinopolyspora halotolerans]
MSASRFGFRRRRGNRGASSPRLTSRPGSRVLLAGVVGALLIVSGCGSDDGGDSGESGSEGDGAAENTGGTFSVGTDEPDHLTPHRMTGAFNEVDALFSGLVEFGDGTEPKNLHAESIESDDNIVWTITLKDGWTWHNGEPVVAEDYVDAWNATAYGPNGWANNAQLSNIEGYDELNPQDGEPEQDTLSGLEVIDDRQFQVTLKSADSQFPYKLKLPGFYALPAVAFEDPDAFDEAPIGNGPFRMDGTWEHDVQISMVRYEDYRGPQPNADGVIFKIYSDQETAYTDAVAGQVDIVSVPQTRFQQVEQDFGDRFISFQAVRLDWVGFPLWDERFQDKRLRQAISMAIDRDEINEAIFAGIYEPATSLHGANVGGGGTEGLCGEYCEFNPERANELLAESGWTDSTLELWYPGGVGYDQTFEAIANQVRQNLDAIDEVQLQTQPGFPAFIEALEEHSATGMFRGGWGSLYPTMQNQLTEVWSSMGSGRAGAGSYENPDVDALIQQADAASTLDEANELYKQAEALIMDDFPGVPLFYATYNFAHSENVSNVIVGFDEIELTDVVVNS